MNNYYPFGLTFNSYQRVTAKENKYLFNGMERQTELDLVWDLTEFRSYSPEIGRWHQIDPKASERESPYVGFANNPILYVDPLGDTIVDNNGAVAKLRDDVNSQINALNTLISNPDTDYTALGVTREQMVDRINRLTGVNGEITILENSEQIYNVRDGNDTGVSFNAETGTVDVAVNVSESAGLIGHEMLHAFQFETGQISIKTDNSGYGALYDIGDETAGYERERFIGAGIVSYNVPPRTDSWVRNLGASMTPPAYQNLPSGPRNVNTIEGSHLIMRTAINAQNGRLNEVLNGYQRIVQIARRHLR